MRFYRKKRNNHKLFIVIIGLFIISLITLYNFSSYATPKVISLAKTHMDTYFASLASSYQQIIKDTTDLNVITIRENSNHEITAIDYDIAKIYVISENLTSYLEEKLNEEDTLELAIPIGRLTESVFLSNFGPKIPVQITFIKSLKTNAKTKVTDYGINNALINIVLEVELTYTIITPITEEKSTVTYELILDSSVVQGKVPNLYGSSLESKSAFLAFPF